MKESKTTEGKWTADSIPNWEVGAASDGRDYTCYVMSGNKSIGMAVGKTEEESLANARLIAAAPDLLSLLEELIAIEGPQPGTSDWAEKVKAAISKAKGSQ